MVTKQLIHIVFLLIAFNNFSQTEEQLKYSIKSPEEFKSFIISSPKIGELNSHFHSKSTYSDIYLDTPDLLLLKNNLSLRFRKRIFDDSLNTITYSMQLKNEMNTSTHLRMEVEESELDFYFILDENKKVNLRTLLEKVFLHFEKTPMAAFSNETKKAINLIEKWIRNKATAPIAPFQKMRTLTNIQTKGIERLKLATCGSSKRYRSHIYLDAKSSQRLTISQNKIKTNKLPPFFLKNRNYNWLLETSFDNSTFYTINTKPVKRVGLVEFEVEQKHYDKTASKTIFKLFKTEISQHYIITPKFDSKYKQMQLYFTGH